MSSETVSREEAIGQFCGVTGADEDRAKGLLEACDWNLELAINMHVDTDDGRNNIHRTSSNSTAGPSTSMSNNVNNVANAAANTTNNLSSDVITIPEVDEADDDDVIFDSKESTDPFRVRNAQRLERARIEGQRPNSSDLNPLSTNDDDVRPPIRPVRQVLVQHPSEYISDVPQRRYNTRTSGVTDVYDAFRDFQAEAQWQERAQQRQQEGETSVSTEATPANKRTLQEMYRPPLEIMYRGPFVSAREQGSLENKWLLVNIQNGGEFACQILNRDVWSNQTVKDIIKEHFIFWQVYHDSFEGGRFIQFYKVTRYPHVSIIDPRTGEQMKSWPTSIDHNSFCDSVIEFLTDHPSPDGSSDANSMKKLRVKEEHPRTLYDQSEDAQMEAAIKASLEETTAKNSSSSKAFLDDDSYTDAIESDTDQEQTRSSIQAHTGSPPRDGPLESLLRQGADVMPSGSNEVNSVNKAQQDFKPLHRRQAFSGEGRRLGAPSPETIEEQPTVSRDSDKAVASGLMVDETQPTTTIQIRLVDNTRLVVRANLDNTVGDLVSHVRVIRPQYSNTNFVLATTFPAKELIDLEQTLSQAKLANASVLQKIKRQ